MTDELPAQWALDKAAVEAKYGDWSFAVRLAPASTILALKALARYIEKHEPAPVDPDLELAREICAKVAEALFQPITAESYLSGFHDVTDEMEFALSKLKERGK